MYIKDIKKCDKVTAGDNTALRELLNPLREDIKIRYSLAHAIVKPGEITIKHKLKNSEVYYILQGEGLMHIDDETEKVQTGQAVYIPPDSVQFIQNTGQSDLSFLCIVDPAWKAGDEEILV